MAAASNPTTSGIKETLSKNNLEDKSRPPTVEELIIQIENHLYNSTEHRASLLIAAWTCLGGQIGFFRSIDKVFHMMYRESALMILSGHWTKVDILFKRGLSRAMIQFSHSMGIHVKGSEGLCSALVMAAFDPWGDPGIRLLLGQEDIDSNKVYDFVKSEPIELLLIRVECLVSAHCEEAAIQLCRSCLQYAKALNNKADCETDKENWRLSFMEWLLRLLFRKRRLNDLVTETSSFSCHDGVRLIHRTLNTKSEDSDPLSESLINLFLVRDLLFKSNYCCTSDLMNLWCDLQVKKQKSVSEIQDAALKLLVGHASSSAQFYLFVDILWGKFGMSLLPLYLELYIRGLTSDLNFLETVRQTDKREHVIELENHMAAMYFKLSSLFCSINKEVSLECLLSAFSLNPTKEILDWIKKITLQISKDKGMTTIANLDLNKHNRSTCTHNHNCTYPTPLKRKAVVMCDQAIQVGDDSFVGVKNKNDSSGALCQDTSVSEEKCELEPKRFACEAVVLQTSSVNNSKRSEEHLEQPENLKNCELPKSFCNNETNKCVKEENENTENSLIDKSDCNHEIRERDEVKRVKESLSNCVTNHVSTSASNHVSDTETIPSCLKAEAENNCLTNKDCISGSQNLVIGENHIIEQSVHKLDCKKDINCDNTDNVSALNNTVIDEDKIDLDKPAKDMNSYQKLEVSKEQRVSISQNHNNVISDKCINGYEEMDCSPIKEDSPIEIVNNEVKDISKINTDHENNVLLSTEVNSATAENSQVLNLSKDAITKCPTGTKPAVVSASNCTDSRTTPSEIHKNVCLIPPFSHVVLDCKLPGISNELLSDFVTVLESLRNKLLKSSSKWSQIKHLCEDYLEIVSEQRSVMLNLNMNGSIDSEADSTSELTAYEFDDFDYHQSNSSMFEDHCADKSHVFKRFMNSDKISEMATYVNLSDIHCPQIPLEKLFYTEYSSSHAGHKKRHRKHRNHDKNPKKLVLRKLRHGNRAERDLIKRKKRKKRKGKRGKGHVKKHHSTRGKVDKAHSKTKRKRHKLKKKKEGNSGFISGDYCSDFSSEELMRIVKEHSNSYSKLPATTSKHPHAVGSASSSDSNEPARKKRKVSFDKKGNKDEKYKHKHLKSKSNKHKKKITVESCKSSVTNVIRDNPITSDLRAVKDFPHFLQFSQVKKMEAVQIQQRSVSMVDDSTNGASMMSPCVSNPQIKQFVQQNFESYSPDDVMKMQLLMARQQAEVTAGSSAMSTNQALRKYVCSKMTSQLLSVAQSSKCIMGSDSEASKSPTPNFLNKSAKTHVENSFKSQINPQKISANIKHFVIETTKAPYKLPKSNLSTSMNSNVIPISISGNSYSEAQNLIGTMLNSNIRCPAAQVSPQVTAFSIPISQNSGNRLIANKIIIPLPSSSQIGSGPSSPNLSLIPSDSSFNSASGNTAHSSLIIVKNGNNTQIIQGPQTPCNILPCIQNANVSLTTAKNKNSLAVPKMIKQTVKKVTQPVTKRTLNKNPALIKNVKAPLKTTLLSKTQPKTMNLATTPVSTKLDTVTSNLSIVADQVLPEMPIKVPLPIPLEAPPIPESDKEETKSENVTQVTPTTLTVKEEIAPIKLDTNLSQTFDSVSDSINTVETEKMNSSIVEDKKTISTELEQKDPLKDTVSSDLEADNKNDVTLDLSNNLSVPTLSDDKLSKTPDSDNIIKEDIKEDTNICLEESESKEKQEDSELQESLSTDTKVKEEVEPVSVKVEPVSVTEAKPETDVICDKSDSENSKVSSVQSALPFLTDNKDVGKEEIEEVKALPENDKISSESFVSKDNATPNDSSETITESETIAESENIKTPPDTLDLETPVKNKSKEIKLEKKESSSGVSKLVNTNNKDQQKHLQPISSSSTTMGSSIKTSGKVSSQSKTDGISVSEVQTRSFTSISDAVRFSLMDMDDATDSVENQVLQAFQVSHETSEGSPRYDNSSTDGNEQVSPSAVILTTPQSASTTDLTVTQVSQRFEASVHSSPEKFSDCQSTVSRSTSWMMEESTINETQSINLQKSPDIDSSCEGKEEEKPKKKKKRKERCDPETAHKFWCEICHKGFFSAYNLRRHCRNVHKMPLPKGTTELPFASNSHGHQHMQQSGESSSSEIVSPPRLPYGTQSSCVSPKGSDYILQSPTRESKTQDFTTKSATNQHTTSIQSDFQMQTASRITGQSTNTHISPPASVKSAQSDFQLPTPTTVSSSHLSPTKLPSVSKSPTTPKFQRLPTTPCSTAVVSQMSQISICGQQSALQQQRQLGQLQSPGLIQPVPSVACQAQQLQAPQCPHFQSKQIAQQRIGQLQLMHHSGQLPALQHAGHGVQKQGPVQQYKKCGSSLQSSKMTDSEQIQTAQLAQTQQILANQQMQKIMQIRQNAIAATGVATQLSLGAAVSGAQSPNVKAATQCFQSQLAVARQAAAVAQLSAAQRSQGASFALSSHDSSTHQFFAPSVQPTPEQSSCSHASFSTQNLVEYSTNAPSYPTIRLSSEANDGLEDLEQFLMENMPWSSDQASHGIAAQQSGNRPSSADSLTLSIPASAGVQLKSKTPISRPKARKPVVTPCSKNLLGNLGRGVKKKSAPKKSSKVSDINSSVSKSDIFSQNCINNQQPHGMDLMQMHCDKGTPSDLKQVCKGTNMGSVNETDSSDSVQCINVSHHTQQKNVSAGINFNSFIPTTPSIIPDKSINPPYNVDINNTRLFNMQNKNSFLEHGNLVNKNSSNLGSNKNLISPCEINPSHPGNIYPHNDKNSSFSNANYCHSVCSSVTNKRPESDSDIFLGQRNSETSESSNCREKSAVSDIQSVVNTNCQINKTDNRLTFKDQNQSINTQADHFLGGRISDTNNNSVNLDDNITDCVTKSASSEMNEETKNSEIQHETDLEKNQISHETETSAIPREENSLKPSSNKLFTFESSALGFEKENDINTSLESIDDMPSSSLKNSTINTEQMQELGMKEVTFSNKTVLKEKTIPSKHKEFNSVVSKNVNSSKQSFNGFSVSRILDNSSNSDIINTASAKKIDNKENVSLSSAVGETDNSIFRNVDKGGLLPKLDSSEKESSHEKYLNCEKFPTETCSNDNEIVEKTSKRVALRVENFPAVNKGEECDVMGSEENNLNSKQSEKLSGLVKMNKKKLPNKKSIQENNFTVKSSDQTKTENLKLDINSNIEKTNTEKKIVNGSHCAEDGFCKVDKFSHKETRENDESFCLNANQQEDTSKSSGRLRLRDTPKTSVKRVCPCCINSRVPKRCRAPKGHSPIKSKSTLKTKNIQNSKVNTRSSQRLRSRNNAVS